MKSDPQFYKIFNNCPEFFNCFAPIDLGAGYAFTSREYKDLARKCDGVFEAADPRHPTYLVEFQAQPKKDVYPRLFLEMAAYQLENEKRTVRGLIIFPTESEDPKPTGWRDVAGSCGQFFRVLYLDQALADLPDEHPLKSVFMPFLERDDVVRRDMNRCYQNLATSKLEGKQKDALIEVFISWITQNLNLTKKEVAKMFHLTPLEETPFYKEVKAEGRLEKGQEDFDFISKALETLKKGGELSQESYDTVVQTLRDRLTSEEKNQG